ncbi:MAG: hypothetical protein IIU00_06325 [Clostridia bacterium]|nr:hypothetical protein [Clostridia bacterium]
MAFFQIPQPDAMDELAKKMNETFITQLNASSVDSENAPKLFAADLTYARMLQRKRLQAKGITFQATHTPDDPPVSGVSWKMDHDARYVTRLPFIYVNTKREFSVSGNVKKSFIRKEIFYSNLVWLRGQQPDAPYSCPNCGGATTLGNLTEGCPFCGTRFLADDLYPKVVNYYTLLAPQHLLKRLKPFAIAGAIAMAAFGLMYNGKDILAGLASGGFLSVIGWLFYAAIAAVGGAFLGYIIGVFSIFFEVMVRAIASVPTIIRYGTAKRRLPDFMRRYSPDFSSDRFIGKLLAMLHILVYTHYGDMDNCALYGGKPIGDSFSDIIDMSYNGDVNVRKCAEKNGCLYIDLDLNMDVVSCKGGQISRGNQTFRMTVCRSASAPEDYGFSVKAIQCCHCGGSFDATKEKHCPFCSTPYSIRDYDWVVLKVEKK